MGLGSAGFRMARSDDQLAPKAYEVIVSKEALVLTLTLPFCGIETTDL